MSSTTPKQLSRAVARAALWLGGLLAVAGTARADDSEACRKAQQVIGDKAATMLPDECQEAVDAAEEERWQLWLDMGLAHEQASELVNAAQYYQRFLDGADQRERPLGAAWEKARADARASLERIDAELLRSYGRVDVTSTPSDAMASFEGKAAGMASFTTPFRHYLLPGEHMLQLYSPTLGKTVDRAFSLSVGQKLALAVDLTAETPPRRPAEKPVTTKTTPKATVSPPGGKPAREAPPVLETVGWLGVGAGAASLALGTVLYVQGAGLVDESKCSGEAFCEPTAAYRAKRKADGEDLETSGVIAWAAGAVLLGGGIAAIVLAEDDDASGASAASADGGVTLDGLSAAPLPGGASVGASLRF